MKTALVIGGGVAGCAAAHHLIMMSGWDVLLVEAAPFLGAGVRTNWFGGHPYTFGPRHFLTQNRAVYDYMNAIVPLRSCADHQFITYVERDNAFYNYPIHEDDIIATIPKLLEVSSVPATTVNWCGDQTVSLQEWCDYLGSLVGREPIFEASDQALRGNPTTVDRMHELIGGTSVDWRDGIRRMAAKFHPELVGV